MGNNILCLRWVTKSIFHYPSIRGHYVGNILVIFHSNYAHLYCFLFQVKSDSVSCDTKDEDIILDNDFFEDRHTFLNFCEKNHYQFDTLRRAKHSSIMVLHHLHSLTVSTLRMTCSICHKKAVVEPSWICELCPEFDVCTSCYQEKGDLCHTHKLSQHSSTVSHWFKKKEARRCAWKV